MQRQDDTIHEIWAKKHGIDMVFLSVKSGQRHLSNYDSLYKTIFNSFIHDYPVVLYYCLYELSYFLNSFISCLWTFLDPLKHNWINLVD